MKTLTLLPQSVLLFFLFLWPVQAEEVRLFILHTNDIHGHLEADANIEDSSGGFVRIATLIRAMKTAFPGQVVVLDAGDMALGTPTSGLFFGQPTAQSMHSVGYDAVALGNHEFNWGQRKMAELVETVGAPALSANLVDEKTGEHPYRPWTVVEKSGVRLGIFGLVAPDTANRSPRAYTAGWRFLSAEEGAKQALAELPPVDAVIALTHIGVPADRKLAQAYPQLDLIVGGHSHTALQEVVYEAGVPIVQTGCYARFLGLLEVEVDTERHALKVLSYRLIPIDESVAPDPVVAALVDGYAEQVRPLLDRVAAQVNGAVSKSAQGDNLDTALGNLIADVFRQQAESDIAFYNRGGVRNDMPAGPLTVRAIHQLFPFDDPVVVLEANGAQLQDIVEQGAVTMALLSPSGLTARIDRATGKAWVLVGGQPLDKDKTYTIAVTQFLSTGGDGMATLAALKVKRVLPFTRDVFIESLQDNPTLEAPATGRTVRE